MVTKPDNKTQSPAMAQFHRWKAEYPTEVLFFQMGDFFEMFYDDAKTVSRELGLTLTSRSKGKDAIPMAGVPLRAVDRYLKQLVAKGHRVAICEQIEDPKNAKGVVERAVTRIVTAGTLTEDDLLERGAPNWLAAVAPTKASKTDKTGERSWGIACADLSTGAFVVTTVAEADVADTLARFRPAEILHDERLRDDPQLAHLASVAEAPLTSRPEWEFEPDAAREALQEHYHVRSLDGFGLDDDAPSVPAAGAALRYLQDTQKTDLAHLDPPRREERGDRLLLDRATRACLELTETAREGRREGSLLSVLDRTVTALGARLVRGWLLAPLKDVDAIRARQAAVAELVEDRARAAHIGDRLAAVADIERLLTRVVTNRANARDLTSLRQSLDVVPDLRAALDDTNALRLQDVRGRLDPLPTLTDLLTRALVDEPPANLAEGGVIRDGYSTELDELRAIHKDGKSFLARYQAEECERTGIANLKIGFNRVFGFYLEITNASRERVPDDYIRKQTLKNAERYITPRLKEYETKVLTAEERALELEAELFQAVRDAVVAELDGLKKTAGALAELDVLFAFADGAALHGYVRPEVSDDTTLEIVEGRHPVLAATMGASTFVPNDCRLEGAKRRLAIVTGPNMAGKSTYIRQVALIQILAQVGAFVPARRAKVGVCDRVFARVGASDDLARGNSTFMVEMTETANILNNASDRSLVILDEVGRGTSTFDGLAIAWAISEHLLQKIRCRGLFATHYHQLIELTETFPAACNLNVAVREWGEEIVFLHQIVEGGSDRSYGIHVARLAGVPRPVLERAQAILKDLEANHPDLRPARGTTDNGKPAPAKTQASLFDQLEKRFVDDLKKLDLDRTAPMDALMKLREWKERLK